MEFNREDFGRRVKQARMDKHLTQPQLADLLGIEWQQISRIERGFSGCSNELLVPLSEELDVSTDYLLKGVESDSELLRRQISLLMDHTDNPRSVADPWYTGDFETTYRDIVEGCEGLLRKLTEE